MLLTKILCSETSFYKNNFQKPTTWYKNTPLQELTPKKLSQSQLETVERKAEIQIFLPLTTAKLLVVYCITHVKV